MGRKNHHTVAESTGSQANKRLSAILLGAGFLLILWRAFFGFDWSDESYYAASVHQILLSSFDLTGNHSIHQFSAVALTPIALLYKQFSGGLIGIILVYRLVYCTLIFAAAMLVYRRLKHHGNREIICLLTALFVMLFAPAGMATLSYNSVPSLLLVVLVFFILNKPKNRGKQLTATVFMGFLLSLAVMSYPTYIVVVPVYAAFFLREVCGRWNLKEPTVIAFITIGVLAAFLLFFWAYHRTPLHEFLWNVQHMLQDSEHQRTGFFSLIHSYLTGLHRLFGGHLLIAYGVTTLLLMCCAFRFFGVCGKDKLSVKLQIGSNVVVLLLFLLSLVRLSQLKEPAYIKVNYLYAVTAAPFIPLRLTNWRNSGRSIRTGYVFIMGALSSLAVHVATNNGFPVSSLGLLLSGIATLIEAENQMRCIGRTSKFTEWRRLIRDTLLVAATIMLAIFRVSGVYRDSDISMLNARMKKGPAAGLYTSGEAAHKYDTVLSDIEAQVWTNDSRYVLFSKLLPFGYIYADKAAGAPSTWRYALQSPKLEEYYEYYSDRIPGVVFILKEDYGITNANNELGNYWSEEQLFTGGYEKHAANTGVIYAVTSLNRGME